MISTTPTHDCFVEVKQLHVTFTGGKKPVQAVSGVDLRVQRGEVVALIGESGSGKSVTLRSLLGLHAAKPPASPGTFASATNKCCSSRQENLAASVGEWHR